MVLGAKQAVFTSLRSHFHKQTKRLGSSPSPTERLIRTEGGMVLGAKQAVFTSLRQQSS